MHDRLHRLLNESTPDERSWVHAKNYGNTAGQFVDAFVRATDKRNAKESAKALEDLANHLAKAGEQLGKAVGQMPRRFVTIRFP